MTWKRAPAGAPCTAVTPCRRSFHRRSQKLKADLTPFSDIQRGGIAFFTGKVENGSLKKIQIADQGDLLDLENADGGATQFQKTQCTAAGGESR